MPNVHHIYAVAGTEAKLLLRTIAIKFLWVISLLYVLFFTVLSLSGGYRYEPVIPGTLATKCFFWFSIYKILFSPFLAPVFVREDSRNDSFRALSARPFTNADYLFGKMFGFTGVMLLTDYVFMFVLFVTSILMGDFPVIIWPYLLYPLFITVPLSFFLFGYTVFLALIKYSLAFFGTVCVIMVFLPLKDVESLRSLDLGAITLPLAYSSLTGFYDVSLIFIQRMIFVFAGLGLVCGACLLSEFARRSSLTHGNIVFSLLIVACCAVSAGFVRLDQKPLIDARLYRAELRRHHDSLVNHPHIRVNSCHLHLVHDNDTINVNARLGISNPNDTPLDRFWLSLNPGLEVYNITSQERVEDFTCCLGTVEITLGNPLPPQGIIELVVSYNGSIDQEAAYLHIPERFRERIHRAGLTVLGKQTAYIERKIVVLPPEVNWYPEALSQYRTSEPGYDQRDLAGFSLEVETGDGLIPVSQGQMTKKAGNIYSFIPETPLTQISLTIAPYKKASVDVDGVEYSYYWIKKGIVGKTDFTQRQLERAVRQAKKSVESELGLTYPFKRYQIVQTPVHFFGYNSAFDLSGVYEQPEVNLISESSVLLRIFLKIPYGPNPKTFDLTNHIAKVKFRTFYSTTTNSIKIARKMNPSSSIYNTRGLQEFATDPFADYGTVYAQYGVFTRGRVSQDAMFNLMAANWLRSRLPFSKGKGIEPFFWNKTIYDSFDRAEYYFLSSKSLNDILSDERYYAESLDILNSASKSFFRMYAGRTGMETTLVENTLLGGFKSCGNDLAGELALVGGTDVSLLLDDFARQRNKAHYEISDITVYQEIIKGHPLCNTRFIVTNPTSYHGFGVCRLGTIYDRRYEPKDIYMEPYSIKEVGLMSDKKIDNLTFHGLPFRDEDIHTVVISDLFVSPDKTEFFEGARKIEMDEIPVEIVMDNLSDKCRIVNHNKMNVIRRFFASKRKKKGSYLKFALFKGMKAPGAWTLAKIYSNYHLNAFYGPFGSVYYKSPGRDESSIEYTVSLPEPGRYSVFLSVPKRRHLRLTPLLESGNLGETTVRVFADDGVHKDVADVSSTREEWAYVGTYSFSDSTAVIQITDETTAELVVADAIKLKKVE